MLDKGRCDADEYPPRYLLSDKDPEMINAGQPGGQLIRYLPREQNRAAGRMWRNVCFTPPFENLSPAEFRAMWKAATNKKTTTINGVVVHTGEALIDVTPTFKLKFEGDPGSTLFSWDNWYNNHDRLYDFTKPYNNGSNGS